ncbi:hypothetical protein F5Y16DRAFT_139254 [Xylariaceae sp. FL0255]|nr:hypothetical protein F5Y16DRAFT_139254 [Xylariaceae sp. FL0255]
MAYRYFRRKWPMQRYMWFSMIAELGVVVGLLVVTALAHPNTYRTKLWQAGYELGYNSSPAIIFYAYAMGKPIPQTPFVWSYTLTYFNQAVAIIALFFLIAKLIAFIMDVWFPIVVLPIYIGLAAIYATSIGGQAGPDHLDPNHPSNVAWYIRESCNVTPNATIQGYCKQAKTVFAISVLMFAVYLFNIGYSIWALKPNKRDARDWDSDDEDEGEHLRTNKGSSWEMRSIPTTPRTGLMPYTPRTQAFNTLDRKLPLRGQ